MEQFYIGQTLGLEVKLYNPQTLLAKDATTISFSTYHKIAGVWTAIEEDLVHNVHDSTGVYKRFFYLDPETYTDEEVIRIMCKWTLERETGAYLSDLEIYDFLLKKSGA